MKISKEEFLAQPRKAITLVGMSGVGKSYLSCIFAKESWRNFSCDYLIGSDYLAEALGGNAEEMREDNISGLSEFIGQVGDTSRGGLVLAEFQRRQAMYNDAELQSVKDACKEIDSTSENVVVDSTGSICELRAPDVMEALGERSLFVYLKVRPEGHGEILKRAVDYPKPLYYSPDFLLERLSVYKEQFDIESEDQVDPVEFVRWVFPHLFEARLEKYEALAGKHGVSIYADQFADVKNADDIINVIADALDHE